MKIILRSENVKLLESTIMEKIKSDLNTWDIKTDINGYRLYYHKTKSQQWENDLYVKPSIDNINGKLRFVVTEIEGTPLKFDPIFGYLMGRFVEILIVHFSEYYSKIEIVK
ncbi:hypothetical protein OA88_20480 [Flavobacterium sp. JRM]|nr:hypothetical protein OA88_20480 [Flavobacterium sp. JRM]